MGSGHSLIELHSDICREELRSMRDLSSGRVYVPVEIRTCELQNTSLDCYRYAILLRENIALRM
jgi:hypothetical protein